MRVLFVTRSLAPDDPSERGCLAASYLHDLRRHHPVDVVAGYVRGRRMIPPQALGVDLCGRGRVQAAWSMRRAVWRAARRTGAEIIVSASPEAPRCGRPAFALLFRTPEATAGLAGRAEIARLHAFAGVLVPDPTVRDAAVQAGLSQELIHVMPPGVSPVARRPSPSTDVLVAGLAPIGPAHGQHLLIDAVSRLAPVEKARVRLVLAGHVEDAVYLGHLRVQAHGQPVRILADPDRQTTDELLATCDLVAHVPLAADRYPSDLVTAAASGVPTVISDDARLAWVMGEAPRVIPTGDVPALRDQIRSLLDAPAAMQDHAARAVGDLLDRLGRDATSRRLAEHLAAVV